MFLLEFISLLALSSLLPRVGWILYNRADAVWSGLICFKTCSFCVRYDRVLASFKYNNLANSLINLTHTHTHTISRLNALIKSVVCDFLIICQSKLTYCKFCGHKLHYLCPKNVIVKNFVFINFLC